MQCLTNLAVFKIGPTTHTVFLHMAILNRRCSPLTNTWILQCMGQSADLATVHHPPTHNTATTTKQLHITIPLLTSVSLSYHHVSMITSSR
jgi:hypothetical protein